MSNVIGYVGEWYEDHIVAYISKQYYDMYKNLRMGIICGGDFIDDTNIFKIEEVFGYQPILNL